LRAQIQLLQVSSLLCLICDPLQLSSTHSQSSLQLLDDTWVWCSASGSWRLGLPSFSLLVLVLLLQAQVFYGSLQASHE
jgi:hypothetical protein